MRKPASSATIPAPIWTILPGIPRSHFIKPLISPEGRLKGTIAFHLDLTSMGFYPSSDGSACTRGNSLLSNATVPWCFTLIRALFRQYVSEALMDKMTSGEGHLYDKKPKPGITTTPSPTRTGLSSTGFPGATLTDITRHETTIVGWGFALAAIIIILFGLYLRHESRTVLMTIINAIKTGDVNQAPRLEAMLSHTIQSNKAREMAMCAGHP